MTRDELARHLYAVDLDSDSDSVFVRTARQALRRSHWDDWPIDSEIRSNFLARADQMIANGGDLLAVIP